MKGKKRGGGSDLSKESGLNGVEINFSKIQSKGIFLGQSVNSFFQRETNRKRAFISPG